MDTQFDAFLFEHTVRGDDKESMLFNIQDAFKELGGDSRAVISELTSRGYEVNLYSETVKGIELSREMRERLNTEMYSEREENEFRAASKPYKYSYKFSDRE